MCWWVPVIQAWPAITGTMAGRPPSTVSASMRQWKVDPIIDRAAYRSPTRIRPLACSAAMRAEQPVPVGWIVDSKGNDTTDPNEFWKGGAILPLGGGISTGGYKGYGLSVMIDILAGVLSGGGHIGESREPGRSGGTCHFQGALSIDGFGSVDNFKAIMDRLIAYLKATEPAEGSFGVLVHGEREVNAEREQSGER